MHITYSHHKTKSAADKDHALQMFLVASHTFTLAKRTS